ncbi:MULTISPECIES: hypothetical protein [Acidianus]|uniref:Uncharacterized protein n=1 Tax=Candidatus Acidianus copahuensis TaxID=1160895 RepID=A0A031LPS4_9CREN|nr:MULTISPECIES: hypothetical protein [Acidianus]EZQ07006.1 hypothetical protein CM19_06510 [Candidatus Acidianus copahuensis]NON61164.1 hypothetical protein [Acidianus sp. RZ1]
MKAFLSSNGKDITIKDRVTIVTIDENSYEISRGLYYLLKGIKSIPRLYGVVPKGDVVDEWKRLFEKNIIDNIKSNLSLGRVKLDLGFSLDFGPVEIEGNINKKEDVKVEVSLHNIPEVEKGLRGLVELDSFYFSNMERKTPFFLPAARSGFLSSFYKFVMMQDEGAPGIPRTLGLISEFVNSVVLPQNFSEIVDGHKIWINPSEGLFVDDMPAFNARADILNLFSLKYFLSNSSEEQFIIIEDLFAHLTDRQKVEALQLIKACKAFLFVTVKENELNELLND